MLGFPKLKAFRYVTLPQAWAVARPVYQNTVVSTIQWTSVVGYITITDLTRTINTTAARSSSPLFALLFGGLLYLGLSYLVYAVFPGGRRRRA